MMKDQYLHNPRCSKSRQALALLEEKGVDVDVRLYLEDTPSEQEIKALVRMLEVKPVELCRKGESVYKESGISTATSDDDVIRLMVANPILIERPILVRGGKARVGRPPETVLEII